MKMKYSEYDNDGVIPYNDKAMAPTGLERAQKLKLTNKEGEVGEEKYFPNTDQRGSPSVD
jgi:hypothetical protein